MTTLQKALKSPLSCGRNSRKIMSGRLNRSLYFVVRGRAQAFRQFTLGLLHICICLGLSEIDPASLNDGA